MKAIIPAAGLGTRFLPATKVTPKELLPVLDKPVIQYVVEEALEPEEVDEVIIINSREKPQVETYFAEDQKLEFDLSSRGKQDLADKVHAASALPVSFTYQDNPRGLGHAVLCAADGVGDEPFFVLLGDYFVPDRQMCIRMAEISKQYNNASVIAVAPVPADQVYRYGIIAGECISSPSDNAEGEGAIWKVTGLVEKPRPEDAMERLLAEEEMYALVIDPEEGCDTGTPAAWAATNARMALSDQDSAAAFKEALGSYANRIG